MPSDSDSVLLGVLTFGASLLLLFIVLKVLVKGSRDFYSGFKEGLETTGSENRSPRRSRIDKKALEKQAWLNASNEVQNNYIDAALWAKAFAGCDGDEQKQKAMYLTLRQREIFDQLIQNAKQG